MATRVERSEIVDYETYSDQRVAIRQRVMEIKRPRRIHLGDSLTFLFENRETIRYQIQEMIRAEKIVREAAIQHEIETYNSLLGESGELGCSLLIEIEDVAMRRKKLAEWRALPKHIYLKLGDGSRVYADFDPTQIGEDRLSAVQYLKFKTAGRAPVAVGSDLPGLELEQELTQEQRAALQEDLGE